MKHNQNSNNFLSPEISLKINSILNLKSCINNKYNSNINNHHRCLSPLRIEQYDSFSNEHMDFFRLDYLKESKKNNRYNFLLENIKPLNRHEYYLSLKELGKKIKFVDSLKKKNIINRNDNINKNIDYLYDKITLKNNININTISQKSNSIGKNATKVFPNLYLSNLNDYSIKEEYNLSDKIQNKKKGRIIFPILVNKSQPCNYVARENFKNKESSRFYQNYYQNLESMGFRKKKDLCCYFEKIWRNKFFFRKEEKGNKLGSNNLSISKSLSSDKINFL